VAARERQPAAWSAPSQHTHREPAGELFPQVSEIPDHQREGTTPTIRRRPACCALSTRSATSTTSGSCPSWPPGPTVVWTRHRSWPSCPATPRSPTGHSPTGHSPTGHSPAGGTDRWHDARRARCGAA